MKKTLCLFLFLVFLICSAKPAFAVTEKPTPTSSPIGQVIKLDFRLPGIGSESGNLTPLHPTRNVILYFFSPDVNSSDSSVKPVASFKTQAEYDSDTVNPTYGSFVNQNIELAEIPSGKYQISFKTDQALPYLAKEKETDLGGKIFEIKNVKGKAIAISNKTVIVGDIYPTIQGDNIMDLNDYRALIDCFGQKADTESCRDKTAADLDDNGVVDGTDFNLMSSSFKILHALGFPVPSIFADSQISTKPTITKSPPKPTSVESAKRPARSGSIFPVILVIIVLAIAASALIFFLKKRKHKLPVDQLSEKTGAGPGVENTPDETKEEKIDKEFYIKKQADDPENKRIVLSLTDDTGPTLGYFSGKEVKEGFAQVKGTLRKEGAKIFIDVSEINPEKESTS